MNRPIIKSPPVWGDVMFSVRFRVRVRVRVRGAAAAAKTFASHVKTVLAKL